MPFQPGTLVGRYRIERLLGENKMAVVYAATHTGTAQRCAVKVIHPRLLMRAELRALFVREVQIGARIGKSPYIVDVYEAGVDEALEAPYLAMELLEGESLQAHVATHGAMPPDVVATLFEQLGEALDQAHEAGMVHRDLKPGNLVLLRDRKGRVSVKILDFGIAKVLHEEAHETATQIGTPMYAAPEQMGAALRKVAAKQGIVIASDVSAQTDVWALGLIAFELLTGHAPGTYWGTTSGTELPAVVTLEEAAPASARAGERASLLPPCFDEWLTRCLEKDASKRFAKASEATDALVGLLRGMGANAGAVHRHVRATTHALGPSTELAGVPTLAPGDAALPSQPSASVRAFGPQTAVAGGSTLVPAQAVATEPAPMRTMPEAPAREAKKKPPVAVIVGGVVVLGIGAALLFGRGTSSNNAPGASSAIVLASAAPPKPACPEGMSVIPAGSFQMGSNEGKPDEKPVHEVKVEGYCMDTTEVAVSAYEACVKAGSCRADRLNEQFWDNKSYGVSEYCNWGKPEKATHPINCVDWNQATAYCGWAKKRLPTEEEWEYAAKGTDGRKYPWGNEAPGPTLLNACGSECRAMYAKKGNIWASMYDGDDGWASTAPVGSYKAGASPFGVLDLAGNVLEWTSGGYSKDYSSSRADESRVSRGGGWGYNVPSGVRAAFRYWFAPTHRFFSLGFRCAR